MPASPTRGTQAGVAAPENSALVCRTCGKSFSSQAVHANEAAAVLVEEESARCRRMREITQQRQTLAARIQAGFAGMLGTDTADTIDLVAHRKSLAQLDSTLGKEAEDLSKLMRHVPREP